jgi:hypothetical protein
MRVMRVAYVAKTRSVLSPVLSSIFAGQDNAEAAREPSVWREDGRPCEGHGDPKVLRWGLGYRTRGRQSGNPAHRMCGVNSLIAPVARSRV